MDILSKALVMYLLLLSPVLFSQESTGLEAIFQETYELESSGEYSQAISMLKEVYDETSYEINIRLGWLTYLSGNFTESIPYYKRCIELKPLSVEARLGLVYPASSMGNWTQVEKAYLEILEIDPQNPLVDYRMGLLYYGREDYLTAEKYFKKVINFYPFDYDGTLMMAWTELKLGKSREAKVLFQKVLLINPGDESAQEGLELLK